MPVDLATLTKAHFEPLKGTTFLMHITAERAIEAELVEVNGLSTPAGAPREAFHLRFRVAERSAVPQRIYALEHPAMGSLEIFLVPAGPDNVGMRYDAVFA